jgi:O-6-methylguanine DNA methyltransferase
MWAPRREDSLGARRDEVEGCGQKDPGRRRNKAMSDVVVFDEGLPVGPLAVVLQHGAVVEVRAAEGGEGRPARAEERQAFLSQILGEGLFCYPFSWQGVGAYHRRALEVLLGIPPGETRSYRWVAERTGNPQAARAVGAAMARNPYPVLVPCHRVVLSSGSLGSYGFGGTEMKEALLRWEGEMAWRRSKISNDSTSAWAEWSQQSRSPRRADQPGAWPSTSGRSSE